MLIIQIAAGILLAVFVLNFININWPNREEIAWKIGEILVKIIVFLIVAAAFTASWWWPDS